jgi:hypothetical protein
MKFWMVLIFFVKYADFEVNLRSLDCVVSDPKEAEFTECKFNESMFNLCINIKRPVAKILVRITEFQTLPIFL